VYHRRPGPASVFTPLGGVALLFAGFATLIVAAVATEQLGAAGLVGLAVGELGLVAVPLVAARYAGIAWPEVGLRASGRAYLASGFLIGSALWYLNWQLVVALDIPGNRVQVLAQAVVEPPLWLALLAMTVLPAVCEEVMFRGVVLRAFAGAWSPPIAVAVSAALFSAYHVSLPQTLPTFTLGLALGALALRAGSVYPTMIAHLMNNLFPVLITREEVPALNDWIADHAVIATIAATVLVTAGIGLIAAPPPLAPVVQRGRA
jgi:membrane protease YdiL (CAAX protease family)